MKTSQNIRTVEAQRVIGRLCQTSVICSHGSVPDAVVSGKAHDEAAEGVCKSGTVLAEARIAEGDYPGAEAILGEILNHYDPNCRKAQELYAHLRTPGYFNKTVDAGFINK